MAKETEHLNLRLTPAQSAVLRLAADDHDEVVSDYVLRHAVEAAEMDLADRRVFVVGDAEWNELKAKVSDPPKLPPRMTKLLSEPSIFDGSDP